MSSTDAQRNANLADSLAFLWLPPLHWFVLVSTGVPLIWEITPNFLGLFASSSVPVLPELSETQPKLPASVLCAAVMKSYVATQLEEVVVQPCTAPCMCSMTVLDSGHSAKSGATHGSDRGQLVSTTCAFLCYGKDTSKAHNKGQARVLEHDFAPLHGDILDNSEAPSPLCGPVAECHAAVANVHWPLHIQGTTVICLLAPTIQEFDILTCPKIPRKVVLEMTVIREDREDSGKQGENWI